MTPRIWAGRVEPIPLPAPWSVFPPLAAAASIAVGVLVLAGWYFDIEILKRARIGFVAMNPMTAILFILAGTALGVSLKRTPSEANRWVRRIVPSIVLAIAGAKLIDLGLNSHLNVDQWLFAEKLGGATAEVPNRMAPNTAVNFVLMALSLLSLDLPVKRFSFSQFFALLTAFGAVLPITGYAYGARSFQGLMAFIPMALHTAITCLLLALGLFFAREATPLAQLFATPDARGLVARRLFPLMIPLTLFLGWLRLYGERRGLFDAAWGTALFALVLCALFTVVILSTVWAVGKIEEQRDALRDALLEKKLQLEESLSQTQLIIDHARELILTLDAQAKLLTVNAACDAVLEMPPRRLLGRSFMELHSIEEEPQIKKSLAVAKTGMTAETFSARCLKADNTFARLNWSIQWSPHFQRMYCVGRAA